MQLKVCICVYILTVLSGVISFQELRVPSPLILFFEQPMLVNLFQDKGKIMCDRSLKNFIRILKN